MSFKVSFRGSLGFHLRFFWVFRASRRIQTGENKGKERTNKEAAKTGSRGAGSRAAKTHDWRKGKSRIVVVEMERRKSREAEKKRSR